jgi:hypothetical protein
MRPNAMGLDGKSGIRDPASRIGCRTGISIIPTAFFIIHQRCHERYYIMSISPVSCRPSDYVDCTSRLNLELDYMLQWPLRNVFSTNATKSQAMVINPRLLQLDDACQISLDGDIIDFHQKV